MIVGIDPGRKGGVAVFDGGTVNAAKMPDDVLALGRMLEGKGAVVFIEKLNVRPDDMNFGKAVRVQRMLDEYERLKAGLEEHGVPYIMVHPLKWQSYLGVRIKGQEKEERKRHFRDVAAKAFPNTKVTLWNADALLILLFGMRILQEDKRWVRSNCPVEFDYEAALAEFEGIGGRNF